MSVQLIVEDRINSATEAFDIETDDAAELFRSLVEIGQEIPPDQEDVRVNLSLAGDTIIMVIAGTDRQWARRTVQDLLVADGRA